MRDVFASRAVATGRSSNELAVFVADRQSQTIELQLANIRGDGFTQSPFEAFAPTAQLVEVGRVVEAHHRNFVFYGSKNRRRRPTDLFCNAVINSEFGVFGLEVTKLLYQHVEVSIGDFWGVLLVIKPHMASNLAPQLVNLFLRH